MSSNNDENATNLLTVEHREKNASTLTLVDENTNNSNNKIIDEELDFQFEDFHDNEFDNEIDELDRKQHSHQKTIIHNEEVTEEEMEAILNSENNEYQYPPDLEQNGINHEFDEMDDDEDIDTDEYDRQVQIAKLERDNQEENEELDNYAITALESSESVPTESSKNFKFL